MLTNASTGERDNSAKPNINVTPLIDVLLVMLIIFMVVSPLKPSRFLTKTASRPDETPAEPPKLGLVVTINRDGTLLLNRTPNMGSVFDTAKLSGALHDVFEERLRNRAFRYELRDRNDLPDNDRVEKTVFIKAPRAILYADVMRVLDAIKGAGATPVGLQIDDLN
ncbi:MAG TPA: biopolymer transporter ExbD [Pyrinomonadaceae bacterium]|nr:biopolymer transporter ExbD [Pyrinomonadaceae bacterium]